MGGVCYFLWDKFYHSDFAHVVECDSSGIVRESTRSLTEFGDVFIRDSTAADIIRKVRQYGEMPLSERVYRQKPFGFRTNFTDFDKDGDIKIYTKKSKRGFEYVCNEKIQTNRDLIAKWKLVTSRSTSVPEEDNGQVLRLNQTFIVEPNAVVTESYVLIDTFGTKEEADNCYAYLKTKFFRYLCQPTIVSPDVSKRTFMFVPFIGYDRKWSDKELYMRYNLNEYEIQTIEDNIKESGGDDDA